MSQTSLLLNKIKQLHLPELSGKSFLEIGSKKGLYCGFAEFIGADQVIGIESNSIDINCARIQFPNCDFLEQELYQIPEKTFDVILMLGVLHKIKDQKEFIQHLMERLTATGVLILETELVPSRKIEFISIEKKGTTYSYPSTAWLAQLLESYAWKIVKTSKHKEGYSTYIYHISIRKPYIYLLMQPSGFGKSAIARSLFVPAEVQVIRGDDFLNKVVLGKTQVTDEIREIIIKNHSASKLSVTYTRLFKKGFGAQFIEALLSLEAKSKKADIALDGFIPKKYQSEVVDKCKSLGYMPIVLQWDRNQELPISKKNIENKIKSYLNSLSFNDEFSFSFLRKMLKRLKQLKLKGK